MLTKADALYLKEKIPEWRASPQKFVEEVFKAEPTEQQVQFLKAIAEPGAKVSVKSGHGTGKTTCFAWIIIWFLLCYNPAKIPVTAPTSAQLKDALWAELKMWWERLPPQLHDLFEWKSDHFSCSTGSFAMARTASKERPEALQGVHADNILFLIDEASGVYEEVFQAAGSSMSADNARVAMASNPTKVTGYFYNSHNINRNMWTRLTFDGSKSPRVSEKYIEGIVNEYGKDSDVYRVRVAGDFPQQADHQFIGRDIVNGALERVLHESQYEYAPAVIGVDPAWSGKDELVIYLRQGLYSKLLYHCLKNENDIYIAGIIAEMQDRYKAQAVFIDAGYGTGIKSAGDVMGRNWTLIWFGSTSSTIGYANKRAEMWGKMKNWLKDGGTIENDETLIGDLIGPEAFINLKGQIQLERKDEMEHSPNRADALALTFAQPVYVQSKMQKRVCNTNYDLFG